MVQLQLLDLMISRECGAVPMDAATRADLIDLTARVIAAVFHEEGRRGKEQPTRPQSSGVQVPVPPIACRRAVSISDARGGNEPRSART